MFVDTQVRPQGEVINVVAPSKMKLSAAIRIGAKIRAQCTGKFFEGGKSCALGAAWEGMGYEPFFDAPDFAIKQSAACTRMGLDGKCLPGDKQSLFYRIFDRNDHGESRESIADWLEAQGL